MFDSQLTSLAEAAAARLKERGETVAVGESAAGGLISAALLSIPGASAYFVGGSVTYTRTARTAYLGVSPDIQAETEEYASALAQAAAERLGTDWGISESGAAGPTGSRYGDPAGHAWVAVRGPGQAATRHLLTGSSDRPANMVAFATGALELLLQCLD